MPTSELSQVALEAMRLQNGYALSIDARDWDYFKTLFTPDVLAIYPHSKFNGMEEWLGDFIPFHDTCAWTMHVMTNHVTREDSQGYWATCYGWVQWTMHGKLGLINRAEVLFRDRLSNEGGTWRIARRKLDLLSVQADSPLAPGVTLPHSIGDLADWS
jgi:hypothetical protein